MNIVRESNFIKMRIETLMKYYSKWCFSGYLSEKMTLSLEIIKIFLILWLNDFSNLSKILSIWCKSQKNITVVMTQWLTYKMGQIWLMLLWNYNIF